MRKVSLTEVIGKNTYEKPEIKVRSLETEDMICVSVETGVDPGDFGMGDGGELAKENEFDVWED